MRLFWGGVIQKSLFFRILIYALRCLGFKQFARNVHRGSMVRMTCITSVIKSHECKLQNEPKKR